MLPYPESRSRAGDRNLAAGSGKHETVYRDLSQRIKDDIDKALRKLVNTDCTSELSQFTLTLPIVSSKDPSEPDALRLHIAGCLLRPPHICIISTALVNTLSLQLDSLQKQLLYILDKLSQFLKEADSIYVGIDITKLSVPGSILRCMIAGKLPDGHDNNAAGRSLIEALLAYGSKIHIQILNVGSWKQYGLGQALVTFLQMKYPIIDSTYNGVSLGDAHTEQYNYSEEGRAALSSSESES